MKQTAAYYRSSTQLQEESVTTQQYEINQSALKKGILIDIEYPEPAVSARKKLNERPKMKQLMTDIRIGKIGTLLVYKRDRLARKVEEHLELYKLFMRHGVDVHFIAENEPPMRFDILGELMELFIGVMNQREGEQINLRISDTKLNNFLRVKVLAICLLAIPLIKIKRKLLEMKTNLRLLNSYFRNGILTSMEIWKSWPRN
ncbi:recombinase family protein [Ureibacillus sp. MALMAid1270]|uniref:recombinase family protein n=1 Tax=Ureibacillus sp. MALMAid1270 TaxID=3411629 RepID=UPI003BA4ED75